jgi:hypothetical protein
LSGGLTKFGNYYYDWKLPLKWEIKSNNCIKNVREEY